MSVKVLIVDDHPIFRDGLRQVIAGLPTFLVVDEAATVAAAVHKGVELAPDLVIMDVHLPDGSGVTATRDILAALPATKVIMLSSDNNRSLVDEALYAGACGFIWKQGVASELLSAIEMVMAGRLYLSPELTAGILENYRSGLGMTPRSAKPRLTARDKELLKLVAEGHRNKEIATQMDISPKSVEAYRSRLMKKLGCHSPADLVRFAIREGIISA
jgi:DNA-binding NarL/FixJ family response regulator